MKQEKWITETTEVISLMKFPLTGQKRPFSRSLGKFLLIYLFELLQRIFLLLAVKWPKILVLAVMPIPPPRPS